MSPSPRKGDDKAQILEAQILEALIPGSLILSSLILAALILATLILTDFGPLEYVKSYSLSEEEAVSS